MPKTQNKVYALRKDEALDRLAERINVAQFVAYSPSAEGPQQTFSRIRGDSPNQQYENVRTAIERLFQQSADGTVNVRSYIPNDPQSKPFDYGLPNVDSVEQLVNKRIGDGLHAIVNETIDVSDGGVSGVVESGVVEFSPDDTPRCVERPGTASLPISWALQLIETVYGFHPEIDVGKDVRLEFSVHPRPRGWRGTHTLGWETQHVRPHALHPTLSWPNRFSRFIGDKAYGLLMANLAGVPVPTMTVFHRRIKSFSFGRDTGSTDVWVRTCPAIQHPGKYATKHGWIDPYQLIANEDPKPSQITDPDTGEDRSEFIIPSAIAQSGVDPVYSGSFNVNAEGKRTIEGVAGSGDAFMLGDQLPMPLPDDIENAVLATYDNLRSTFGDVRFEWVFDGNEVWVVQLHRGAVQGTDETIVPGDAERWHRFKISGGLESLRSFLGSLKQGDGLIVTGKFGLTSHIADTIRKAGFPAKIDPG